MKLVKILSLFTCLVIGDAQAYWGQTYVESLLASMRNLWSKSIQPVRLHQKGLGVTAITLGGLGLTGYAAYKYQEAKKSDARSKAEAEYISKKAIVESLINQGLHPFEIKIAPNPVIYPFGSILNPDSYRVYVGIERKPYDAVRVDLSRGSGVYTRTKSEYYDKTANKWVLIENNLDEK